MADLTNVRLENTFEIFEYFLKFKFEGNACVLPPGGICHESAEPLRTLVPSSDGQKGLELLVVSLQAGELGVAAWKLKINEIC